MSTQVTFEFADGSFPQGMPVQLLVNGQVQEASTVDANGSTTFAYSASAKDQLAVRITPQASPSTP